MGVTQYYDTGRPIAMCMSGYRTTYSFATSMQDLRRTGDDRRERERTFCAAETAEQRERRLRQRRERDRARRAAQSSERREAHCSKYALPLARDWHLRLPRRGRPGCSRWVLTSTKTGIWDCRGEDGQAATDQCRPAWETGKWDCRGERGSVAVL